MRLLYRYLIVIILLFIIGNFYDWRIAVNIYNPSSKFGLFFQAIGGLPVVLVPLLACNYLAYNKNIKLFYVASVLLSIGAFNSFIKHFINIPWLIIIVIGTLIFIITLFFVKQVNNTEHLIRLSYMLIILTISLVCVTELTKYIWARPRFVANDGFSPWYMINFAAQSDLYKSFFSGHTANSALLLPLSLCFNTKKKQNIFILIALSFTTLTAISRMVLGQHYLTDVTAGALVSISMFLVFKKIFKLEYKEN